MYVCPRGCVFIYIVSGAIYTYSNLETNSYNYRVFGLMNKLVHYFLTPHFFDLVRGME